MPPNSRASTRLPSLYNGPARERGADYKGAFTATICVAHRLGVLVRQFGEKARRIAFPTDFCNRVAKAEG